MKQPRFAPLVVLALAGSAFATPEAGTYLVVSHESEAIFDLFSMPVVGIAIFVGVVVIGMVIGLQRSAHAQHVELLERQRQALRGRRPITGPASRSPGASSKHPVG